ncbi:unnamed protein product [Paramecium sonneborni]|uniref:Uncharacterized protein n=1 Tax=Paramecium sonneborni TaxID=65129 RepID=A0A8S1RDI6_9CILI|nr:unnamed protein product [Paramecium sonneborni]
MRRPQSPDTMIISFYDLDLPKNQTLRTYKVQYNTTILDIKQYIKNNLNDNYEILLYFEKDKQYNGDPNSYVIKLMGSLQNRQITYKKVLSKKLNYIQKQYQIDQNDDNKQFNNNSNIFERNTQSEHLSQPINKNQQAQSSWNQSSIIQAKGPSQQNYITKIGINEYIQNHNNQVNEFGNQNSQQFIFLYRIQNNQQSINQQQLQNLDQQNKELKYQNSQLKTKLQDYEKQLRQYENENQNIKKERDNQKQLNQQQNCKFFEDYQKLQTENSYLQNQLQITKQKFQQQIETLNKEIDDYKAQIKMKNVQISPKLESKKDQYSIESSSLLQSKYQNINQQQNNYRNKCGHYLDKSQIQAQVYFAINGNKIVQCNICQAPLQSKLCLLIEDYGKISLEIKSQIEIRNISQNIFRSLKYHEKIIKCENNNCQFFCIWQINQKQIQKYNTRQMVQTNGFCPICLKYSIISPSPEIQSPMYKTQQNFFRKS